MRRFITCCIALIGLTIALPLQAASAPQYTWRMAIEEVPDSVQDVYAQELAKRLKEKSNGAIKLDVFPIGQLGTALDIFEMVQNGAIEFATLSPGNTGGFVPENQIFSMQFFFSDDMNVNKTLLATSKALDILRDEYLKKDIKVLTFWPEGYQNWTSNRKLEKPEDFSGLKIRVMPSPMLVAGYEAYGATPTPMPYMEVYSGLQLKMIDAQENPVFAIQEMHFMDVQKYLVFSRHGLYVTTTSTNPVFFASLPEDIQKLVSDTILEMQDFAFATQEKLNADRVADIRKETKSTFEELELTPEARTAFRQKAINVLETYYKLCNNSESSRKIGPMMAEEVVALEKATKK